MGHSEHPGGHRLFLTEVVLLGGITETALISAVATIEFLSEHRIARAIVQYAYDHGFPIGEPEEHQQDPEHGVRGISGGHTWLIGNRDWLRKHEVDLPKAVEAMTATAETAGKTVCIAVRAGEVMGFLVLSD